MAQAILSVYLCDRGNQNNIGKIENPGIGICLGDQLLALASGEKTEKMKLAITAPIIRFRK